MWYKLAQEENLEIHPKEQQARKYYGITTNPYKAGYILRDGSFLDYSEGQHGRTLDHRDIENIMDKPEESKGDRYSDYVEPFLNLTGAIRVSYQNGVWSVDIATSPTDAQIRKIVDWHIPGRDFYYDVEALSLRSFIDKAKRNDVRTKLEQIQQLI